MTSDCTSDLAASPAPLPRPVALLRASEVVIESIHDLISLACELENLNSLHGPLDAYVNRGPSLKTLKTMKKPFLLIAALLALATYQTTWAQSDEPVWDPIPERIQTSGIAVELEDFVTIPSSSENGEAPLAKINSLKYPDDGSGRLFVNDLRGKMYVIVNLAVQEYLDLKGRRPAFTDEVGLGTGFSAIAFHPEFATNGRFYTTHTESANSGAADFVPPVASSITYQWILTEWTSSDPSANAFGGTSRELIRADVPGTKHGFQDMGFNPNADPGDEDYGLLYLGIGDGSKIGQLEDDNVQNLASFLGTIFRIDPLGTNSANGQYGIPPTNPFASDGDPNTLGEIWAYGFRDAHRISWDAGGDGKMIVADIGEKNLEEINLGVAGANYGWPLREGTFLFDRHRDSLVVYPLPSDDAGFTYPVAQYKRTDTTLSSGQKIRREGRAIIGGFVYRGRAIPDLYGEYVFGDLVDGHVFHADADDFMLGQQTTIYKLKLLQNGQEVELARLVNGGLRRRTDLRFGVDSGGELYVFSKRDGNVRRVLPVFGNEEQEEPEDSADGLPIASVTASSFQNGSTLPENAIDGDFGTRWSARGDGQWIQFELAAPSALGAVEIAWYNGDQRQAFFDVETSADGQVWTQVFAGESSGTKTELERHRVVGDAPVQYVRIVGHGNSARKGSQWNSITEVRLYGEPSASAVSVNSVSASRFQDNHLPENAIDGDFGTRWTARGRGEWIQFNLEGPSTLAAVEMACYNGDGRQSFFDVAVSEDGQTWVQVLSGGESSGATAELEHYEVAEGVPVQHVRIVGHGNSQRGNAGRWNSITEIRLIGASAAVGAARGAVPGGAAALSYALDGNYPNPFNPTTEIRFTLPQAQRVTLVVYDLLGREVARLLDGPVEAGRQRVRFDASDLSSGMYLYRLQAGTFVKTRRMVLLK